MSRFESKDMGQFIMTGLSGQILTDEEEQFLQEKNIGGVILFSRNYTNPEQLTALTHKIQNTSSGRPLFIGVDQEGGRVQRFKDSFQRIPPMADIGYLQSPENCRDLHEAIAGELRAVGVNLSFAPVCDVLTNPQNQVIGDRAFGTNPHQVAKYVEAAVQGVATQGIISVAKHFPGHGDTLEDSHDDLPLVKKSLEQIRDCELIPFQRAVQSGVDMILMAHLQVAALDRNLPTTLSPIAYHFLSDELNYDGVVISDDMEMKAISDRFNWEAAAIKAFIAGCDILVYRTMAHAEMAYRGLSRTVRKGEISPLQLCRKMARIDALKRKKLGPILPS